MRLFSTVLLCTVCAAQSPLDVAHAELAFSKLASEKGIGPAFMAFLAEGALVLRPEAADARTIYAKANDPGQLIWHPTSVGVSTSGDLAYSTGPWDYRSSSDAANLKHGHFLSMWGKQPDGTWKVVFDCGISHLARTERTAWDSFLPAAPSPKDHMSAAITAADRALTDGGSIAQTLAFGAVVYRSGLPPLESRAEVMGKLAREPARHFEPSGERTSKAQDLGYTWGVATAADGSRVSYLHVWVRPSGTLRLLYDLELPMPKNP